MYVWLLFSCISLALAYSSQLSGSLIISTCYTVSASNSACGFFSLNLSSAPNAIPVKKVYEYPTYVNDPYYVVSTIAYDSNSGNFIVARGCDGTFSIINLNSQTQQEYPLPYKMPCLLETVFDPISNFVYGILKTKLGDNNDYFVRIDPSTGSVKVLSLLPFRSTHCCLHPPQQVATIAPRTDGSIFMTNFVGSSPSFIQETVMINVTTGSIISRLRNPRGIVTFGWVDGKLYLDDSEYIYVQDTTYGNSTIVWTYTNVPVKGNFVTAGSTFAVSANYPFLDAGFYRYNQDDFVLAITTQPPITQSIYNITADRYTFSPQGDAPSDSYVYYLFSYLS